MKELALGEMEIPATMDIVCEAGIWICNFGASSHSTNSSAGGKDTRETMRIRLGYIDEAVKVTSSIDVPGFFLGKDGRPGACLQDVNLLAGIGFVVT